MPSPNGLRAIFFDLDGTIRHDRPSGTEAFHQYVRELGLEVSPEALRLGERWTHDYWANSEEMRADAEAFGANTERFWQNYTVKHLRRLGVAGPLPPGDYAAAIHKRFDEDYKPAHHVPDDVPPTLRTLRRWGYIVGLVSNRTDPLTALCTELGLLDLFDFTLSAGQANSWKPDRGIFDRAAALAGVPNTAAAYVGDNYYADILGSSGAGLRPILIDPRDLFPEARCTVIRSIGELPEALE